MKPKIKVDTGQVAHDLVFPENVFLDEEQSDRDARALGGLFYFRRILDHQALTFCVQTFRPLDQFFSQSERAIKHLFAARSHLRGYTDAAQLTGVSQRAAAFRYRDRLFDSLSGRHSGRLMMQLHPAFPRRLERLTFPVRWLFSHPQPLPQHLPQPVVAIIGSRQSSRKQLSIAAQIAKLVGGLGGTVITGLATGADTAAHSAAIDTEAFLIAVLGGGIAKPYPAPNARFVENLMYGRGYVLTEVPPDYAPNADAFVLRNRIVAVLADYVIAVSGKYASGTSHTIRFAADAGIMPISADPEPASGITKLVCELGGARHSPEEIEQLLTRDDY